MYIPIPILIWIFLSILVGFKMNKWRLTNKQYKIDGPPSDTADVLVSIIVSPLIFAYMFIVRMFIEDWD